MSVYSISRVASQRASSDENNYLSACDLCQQFQYQSSPSLMESCPSNSIACSINFFFSITFLPYGGTLNNLVLKVRRYLDSIENCNALTIGSGTKRLTCYNLSCLNFKNSKSRLNFSHHLDHFCHALVGLNFSFFL